MCGITGFLKLPNAKNLGSPEAMARRLEAMTSTLVHRGPDDDGFLIDDPVYLGMRRLKIIDLSTGKQPIFNEDGSVGVVFNGEIYNYVELRGDLEAKGHTFKTHSDTEVLVHLYEEMGEDFAKPLRGMFAIALWDNRNKKLILARDHFGIKPLYWGIFGGYLLFASEIKALNAHPAFEREVNPVGIDDSLTLMFIPTPHTIYKNLFKLEPGSLLTIDSQGQTRKKTFWQGLPPTDNFRQKDLSTILRELEEKIYECVRIGMRSDVPLGVFLSSGLDSSAVAYFAKRHKKDLKTFTVYFKEESYSERAGAKAVAEAINSDHAEILMEIPKDLEGFVSRVLACFDEPFGDYSALPTYLLCKSTREYTTVSLSGDGGDELFGGYPTFIATSVYEKYWKRIPRFLRAAISEKARNFMPTKFDRVSLDYKLKRFLSQAAFHDDYREIHFSWRSAFGWGERFRIYRDDFVHEVGSRVPFDTQTHYFKDVKGARFMDQLLYADRMSYLLDAYLVKMDRMSMAHALEVRPPMLDWQLAEYSWQIPPEYKVRGFQTKWIIRKLMEGKIPKSVIKLPKKGFSPPLPYWFLDAKFQSFFRDAVSSSAFRNLGVLKESAVEGFLDQHSKKVHDNTRKLWVILALALFAQRNNAVSAV